MTRFAKSIDVDVPVRTAYNQWTQFQQSPQFMEGVDRVVQLDDKTPPVDRHRRRADEGAGRLRSPTRPPTVAGLEERSTAPTTPVPSCSSRLAPEPTHGHAQARRGTRGPVETVGTSLGFLERRVTRAISSGFKAFIESRDTPTGSWRGEIHGDEVTLG